MTFCKKKFTHEPYQRPMPQNNIYNIYIQIYKIIKYNIYSPNLWNLYHLNMKPHENNRNTTQKRFQMD